MGKIILKRLAGLCARDNTILYFVFVSSTCCPGSNKEFSDYLNTYFLYDLNSFIIPEFSFIPGIWHFRIFFAMITLNFSPLYVVSAEVKRQQNKQCKTVLTIVQTEKQRKNSFVRKATSRKIKTSNMLYKQENTDRIRMYEH